MLWIVIFNVQVFSTGSRLVLCMQHKIGISSLIFANLNFSLIDGTVPSSHWARGKIALLRRKPASSVLRLQRRIKSASLYDFAEFCSNKSIGKDSLLHLFYIKSKGFTLLHKVWIGVQFKGICIPEFICRKNGRPKTLSFKVCNL